MMSGDLLILSLLLVLPLVATGAFHRGQLTRGAGGSEGELSGEGDYPDVGAVHLRGRLKQVNNPLRSNDGMDLSNILDHRTIARAMASRIKELDRKRLIGLRDSLAPPTEPSAFDYFSTDDYPFQYAYYDEYNTGPMRHAPLRGRNLGPPNPKPKMDFPHLRRALRSNMAAIKHYGRVIKRGGEDAGRTMGSADLAWLRDLLRRRQERQNLEMGQEVGEEPMGGQQVGLARRRRVTRGEGSGSAGGNNGLSGFKERPATESETEGNWW